MKTGLSSFPFFAIFRVNAELCFNVQKWSVLEYNGVSLAKKPYVDIKVDSHQSGRNSADGGVY